MGYYYKYKVDTGRIENDAVTEDKIADAAVTEDKIGMYAVTNNKISPGAVLTTHIGTVAVTEAKIANGAVTEDKIATKTKQLFITDAHPYDGNVVRNTLSYGNCWNFDPDAVGYLGFTFQIPSDYVSGGTIKVVNYEDGSIDYGNIIASFYLKQAVIDSEDFTHNSSDLNNTISTTVDVVKVRQYTTSLSLTSPAVGEIVVVRVSRIANDASDTYTQVWKVLGIIFEYTGRI